MRFVFLKLNFKKHCLRAKKNLRRKTKFLSRRVVATTLYLAAALGMTFAIGVSVGEYSLNKRLAAQADSLTRHSSQPGQPANPQSSVAPSTTKPPANLSDSYNVAPDMPRYIRIPKLNVV